MIQDIYQYWKEVSEGDSRIFSVTYHEGGERNSPESAIVEIRHPNGRMEYTVRQVKESRSKELVSAYMVLLKWMPPLQEVQHLHRIQSKWVYYGRVPCEEVNSKMWGEIRSFLAGNGKSLEV